MAFIFHEMMEYDGTFMNIYKQTAGKKQFPKQLTFGGVNPVTPRDEGDFLIWDFL